MREHIHSCQELWVSNLFSPRKWNYLKMTFFLIGAFGVGERLKRGEEREIRRKINVPIFTNVSQRFNPLPKAGIEWVGVRKEFYSQDLFFLKIKTKQTNTRYSRCSYASVTTKPSRRKLKDSAPESLISTCHRSNEYHLNCFVYWWSLDVDLICACVLSSSAWLRERRAAA